MRFKFYFTFQFSPSASTLQPIERQQAMQWPARRGNSPVTTIPQRASGGKLQLMQMPPNGQNSNCRILTLPKKHSSSSPILLLARKASTLSRQMRLTQLQRTDKPPFQFLTTVYYVLNFLPNLVSVSSASSVSVANEVLWFTCTRFYNAPQALAYTFLYRYWLAFSLPQQVKDLSFIAYSGFTEILYFPVPVGR